MNDFSLSTPLLQDMRPAIARRHIKSFGNRFGEVHLFLAYHAAFPLALTPDLLYHLWASFQRDVFGEPLRIPWIAVADLLLSNLCNEVGYELYEMNSSVRKTLLSDLRNHPQFAEQRLNDLSNYLLAYIERKLKKDDLDQDNRDFAQAQRWTALAYINPTRAATELAQSIREYSEQGDKIEVVRVASLIETFAEPLSEFIPLLMYARSMIYLSRGQVEVAANHLFNVADEELQIMGNKLPIPEAVAEEIKRKQHILLEHKAKEITTVQSVNDTKREIASSQTIDQQKRSIIYRSATNNLLVITSGTVAAGVGKEFIKQVRSHSQSELYTTVSYIDTAYLPTRYSDLRDGEWLQMSIDPRFIDNIKRNEEDYPYLKPLLFDDLMPAIQGSGGGSIRYNAAGAVAIGRDRLKRWIHTGITNLISSGDGQADLAISLIVSAVGATGSGTVERLVEIIIDAAQDAKIPSPVHCDVFILQPGWDVTDLGLANTVALYAEMAASRLSRTQLNTKSYRGRTILVGWGSDTNMASIEQLKEAAATLVRLSHDPASNIAAEYQEREVDNHVLREQDTRSRLPSHLSTATAVTISLGDLQEKIIQRDAARLVDMLVFGGTPLSMTDNGEAILTTRSNRLDRPANVMLGSLNAFLNGQTPDERLKSYHGDTQKCRLPVDPSDQCGEVARPARPRSGQPITQQLADGQRDTDEHWEPANQRARRRACR